MAEKTVSQVQIDNTLFDIKDAEARTSLNNLYRVLDTEDNLNNFKEKGFHIAYCKGCANRPDNTDGICIIVTDKKFEDTDNVSQCIQIYFYKATSQIVCLRYINENNEWTGWRFLFTEKFAAYNTNINALYKQKFQFIGTCDFSVGPNNVTGYTIPSDKIYVALQGKNSNGNYTTSVMDFVLTQGANPLKNIVDNISFVTISTWATSNHPFSVEITDSSTIYLVGEPGTKVTGLKVKLFGIPKANLY